MLFIVAISCAISALAVGSEEVETINWPQGYVKVPSWEETYEPNTKYRWILKGSVFAVKKYIKFWFDKLEVEGYKNSDCENDWVAVYKEKDSGRLGNVCDAKNRLYSSVGVFCNHHSPSSYFVFDGQDLIIEFCSDEIIEDNGFEFKWTTSARVPPPIPPKPDPEPDPVQCGGNFTLDSGQELVISSPDFEKGHYPPNVHCQWTIGGAATVFLLSSMQFELEDDPKHECFLDYLSVQLESELGKKSLGRYCGLNGPEIAVMPKNSYRITVDFYSDGNINWAGFQLRLRAEYPKPTVCGSNASISLNAAKPVDFYSPNYPAFDTTDRICSMTIRPDTYAYYWSYEITFVNFFIVPPSGLLTIKTNNEKKVFHGQMKKSSKFYVKAAPELMISYQGNTEGAQQRVHARVRIVLDSRRGGCHEHEFMCRDYTCLSLAKFCDGNADCRDGSDESSEICEFTSPRFSKNCGRSQLVPNIDSVANQANQLVEAKPHTWPWTVIVRDNGAKSAENFCVGTLISRHWVVTSASCMNRNSNAQAYVVELGVHDLRRGPEETVNVRATYEAPGFKSPKTIPQNDIALLRLDQDVKFSNLTRAACLPVTEFVLPPNVYCITNDWFAKAGSMAVNNRLIQEVVSTISSSKCTTEGDWKNDSTSVICVSTYQRRSSCSYNPGSPLFYKNYKGMWTLQGVLSKEQCQTSQPQTYSRVSAFLGFLYSTIVSYD